MPEEDKIEQDGHKQITKKSKTNFLYSFSLLPKEKNDAINIVYAFCRKTDDIVDDETHTIEQKREILKQWEEEFTKSLSGKSNHPLLTNLNWAIKKFRIPHEPFYDLIRGMEMDLDESRYETFDHLYKYCYRAASTVGLMCIEIFGYKNQSTKDFAVNLGIALQLTNILRDMKKDAENGRIYIPLEDINRFGYSEEELLNSVYNESFIKLMEFEAKRAGMYYERANSYLTKEDKGLMFSARIMGHIYYDILKQIEKKNYNVFSNTVKVSKLKKLFYTFGVYFKYRLLYDFDDPRFNEKKIK